MMQDLFLAHFIHDSACSCKIMVPQVIIQIIKHMVVHAAALSAVNVGRRINQGDTFNG